MNKSEATFYQNGFYHNIRIVPLEGIFRAYTFITTGRKKKVMIYADNKCQVLAAKEVLETLG